MSTAATNARFAGELVGGLASAGLSEAFVCPGSRSTPLVVALDAAPGVRVHSVLDERAAGFLALGAARARGKATMVCCTSGSAVTHLMPAVVEAASSGIPLVIVSADRPRELHACGAPQTIDQTRVFGPHVRWFMDLGTPTDPVSSPWVASMAGQAWAQAHGPTGGPVHLNAPFAEPLWEAEGEEPPAVSVAPRVLRGQAMLDDAALAELAQRLLLAKRGVIVAGPMDPATLGGFDQTERFAAAVGTLADTLGWPVVADPLSQLRFGPATAEGLVTHADAFLRSPSAQGALAPDLVLRLGRVPTSKAVTTWIGRSAQSRTISVESSGRWLDPTHSTETLVVADPTLLCHGLARAAGTAGPRPGTTGDWMKLWTQAEAEAARVIAQHDAGQLWEGDVVRTTVRELPTGAVLHVASSMPVRDVDAFGGTRAAALILTANRGTNGIDGTVATAAGQALAWATPMVALCGDLALLHDMGGLAAATQLLGQSVPLVVVVVDNGGGGIFEYLPIAAHPTSFRERFLAPQSTDIDALCRAVGARYSQAETGAQLQRELAKGIQQTGLSVIHLSIDRKRSVDCHRRVFGEVDQAVERCLQH